MSIVDKFWIEPVQYIQVNKYDLYSMGSVSTCSFVLKVEILELCRVDRFWIEPVQYIDVNKYDLYVLRQWVRYQFLWLYVVLQNDILEL